MRGGLRCETASHDHTAKLWSAETGECTRTLRGYTNGYGPARRHSGAHSLTRPHCQFWIFALQLERALSERLQRWQVWRPKERGVFEARGPWGWHRAQLDDNLQPEAETEPENLMDSRRGKCGDVR